MAATGCSRKLYFPSSDPLTRHAAGVSPVFAVGFVRAFRSGAGDLRPLRRSHRPQRPRWIADIATDRPINLPWSGLRPHLRAESASGGAILAWSSCASFRGLEVWRRMGRLRPACRWNGHAPAKHRGCSSPPHGRNSAGPGRGVLPGETSPSWRSARCPAINS